MEETAIEVKVDKSAWGSGEWQDEPDRVDWIAHGFACFVLRHEHHGHWCGYVGVPREHALYGKPYEAMGHLQVHGSVSYAAPCDGAICHVPAEGMPADVWWIGFDCGHTWDKSPGRDARLKEAAAGCRERGMEDTAALFERTLQPLRPEIYRNIYYVRRETEQLAAQLAQTGEPVRFNHLQRAQRARRGKKARA